MRARRAWPLATIDEATVVIPASAVIAVVLAIAVTSLDLTGQGMVSSAGSAFQEAAQSGRPNVMEKLPLPAADPWSFGLNHLLTILGFVITITVAGLGFRSFEKWKREKIEERRIDIALEALALAYEAKFVFDSIRSPMSHSSEWEDMEGIHDPERRRLAGAFFAALKRIEHHRDYFENVRRMQPRFMAAFGREASDTFMKLHQARRNVEVAAGMLMGDAARGELSSDIEFRRKLEQDVWSLGSGRDTITPLLDEFVTGVEKLCVPIVSRKYKRA